jgi:hypothetical protein
VLVSFCDIILRALRLVERVSGINPFATELMAALIAWMLFVRVDDLVKDGAKRRRLRRSTILDKIINTNTVLSMRSRPLSGPARLNLMQTASSFGRKTRSHRPH